MKLRQVWQDKEGGALLEFTVTLPLFLPLIFGMFQAGMLLYTQVGLQHAVEATARCASLNYSAYQLTLAPSSLAIADGCFSTAPATVIASPNSYMPQYAAKNCFGIPSACTSGIFTITKNPKTGACSSYASYQVTASYPYNVITYLFSVTLKATSCFPIFVT